VVFEALTNTAKHARASAVLEIALPLDDPRDRAARVWSYAG
jgi:hypothetical protein